MASEPIQQNLVADARPRVDMEGDRVPKVRLVLNALADDEESIGAYLDRLVPWGLSGTAIVTRDHKTILSRGFGRLSETDTQSPGPHSVFDIGSISKHFAAVAILRLEAGGRLSVDDSLGDCFPNVPETHRAITLHQLLCHTSGIPSRVTGRFDVQTRDDFLRQVFAAPLQFAPGSSESYSNSGFSILAAVVEVVTGRRYEDYLRTEFFAPLGMEHTGFMGEPRWRGENDVARPWGYDLIAQPDFHEVEDWLDGSLIDWPCGWYNRGAGGIASCAIDLQRWIEALFGGRLLSNESMRKFLTARVESNGRSERRSAYGMQQMPLPSGDDLYHHSGAFMGYTSEVGSTADGRFGYVILLNRKTCESYDASVILSLARRAILLHHLQRPLPTEPPPTLPLETRNLEQFVGRYQLDDENSWTVALDDSGCGLRLSPEGALAIAAVHVRHDAWSEEELVGLDELGLNVISELLHGRTQALKDVSRMPDGSEDRFLHEINDTLGAEAVNRRVLQCWVIPSMVTNRRLAVHCAVGHATPEVVLGLYFSEDGEVQAYSVSERVKPRELRDEMLLIPAGSNGFVNYDHEWRDSVHLRFEIHDEETRAIMASTNGQLVAVRR